MSPAEVRRLRRGTPVRMGVWDLRDDDDYSEPTRRMIVVAPSFEAACDLWDCPFTEHNVHARPVYLKAWQLEIDGPARVLGTQDLLPLSGSAEAA